MQTDRTTCGRTNNYETEWKREGGGGELQDLHFYKMNIDLNSHFNALCFFTGVVLFKGS